MTTYNGWANRETWLVNVWFGDYFAETTEEGRAWTSESIREFIEDHVSETVPASSFIADLLDLSAIDYVELAWHYAPDDGGRGDDDDEAAA